MTKISWFWSSEI